MGRAWERDQVRDVRQIFAFLSILRKAPGRHHGHVALLQRHPLSGKGGAKSGDEEEAGEVVLSEAQQQLQELLRKQLDTSGMTVKG